MKWGLTGSSGFVGSALLRRLQAQGAEVLAIGHQERPGIDTTLEKIVSARQFSPLQGLDVIVHLGARVHVMNERHRNPLEAYREVNVATTVALARAAAKAGVKRFVFVSSIKVNGEYTLDQAFRHDDLAQPQDPYGISKFEAEQALRDIAADTGLEVVVVRPPLVYGPGVKANFASLMRAVRRGLPLPLGAVTNNRRSFVALDNLVDLLLTCADHPAAANQTFLVSDGEDLSTAALIRRMGTALGRPARLLPVPPFLLQLGAVALGKREVAQRLLGSLQVDILHTRATLGWSPPITVDEGLKRAAKDMV
jgi:nucleoside-diphosphate-sugar epimerase